MIDIDDILHQRQINLQSTLASTCIDPVGRNDHHPLLCAERLELDAVEFRCPHQAVPIDDWRTVQAIQHSIALLIIEVAAATL